MQLNIGKKQKMGNPGTHNTRDGKVKPQHMGADGSIPNENMGRSQVKGKPGVRNSRKGMVHTPDTFAENNYKKAAYDRGDKAVHDGAQKMGNPGNRNTRGGRVNKHAMFG